MLEPNDLRVIFDRAVGLPAGDRIGYLDRVCGERHDLRRDVERLLAADAQWADLFDSGCSLVSTGEPTAVLAGHGSTADLACGTRLGRYEIVGMLGIGGMGRVYKARDTRLDRLVAIKLLRIDGNIGAGAARRFEREAQAIAALSHPHICSLFDVGREDGTDYLVMECLDGETLASRLSRGKLPRDEALGYAAQIADALAIAHHHGIVHRDLKPGNIMLTASGAKLLDFGLAERRLETASADSDGNGPRHTREASQLIGTLPYMAPEQLRGLAADERSDVFAFGAVLYEMLVGRRAFEGTSPSLVAFRILQVDPPSLTADDASTPVRLVRLVRTCLDKAPASRWTSFDQIRAQIAEVATPPSRRRWLLTGVAGAAALAIALAGLQRWQAAPATLIVEGIYRVTHDRKPKDLPYTDGAQIVYAAWKPGLTGTTLMRVPVTGGEPVPIATPLVSPYVLDLLPGQGELLALDRDRRPAVLQRVSYVTGWAKPVGSLEPVWADMSADGQRLLFTREDQLLVATSSGAGARRLVTAANSMLPRWSPDGRRIRYTTTTNGVGRLREVSADGSRTQEILPGWSACCGAWTPDGRFYVFEAERHGEYGLWALRDDATTLRSASANDPIKLTDGPMRFENPVPSPDGRLILALGTPPTAGELVRWDARVRQFITSHGGPPITYVDFSRDRQWIAYARHPEGTLWRSRPDGRDRLQLTSNGTATMPRWSPDGRHIAYGAQEAGKPSSVFVVSANGGVPRKIAGGERSALDASWSGDGTQIAFSGVPGEDLASRPTVISVFDLRTGRTSSVPGSEHLFSPRWSPDGRYIVAVATDSRRMALYEWSTRRWRDLMRDAQVGWPNWTRDARHIQAQVGTQVVRIRVRDGQVTPVAELDGLTLVTPPGSGHWLGMDDQEVPLALREVASGPDIYALRVRVR